MKSKLWAGLIASWAGASALFAAFSPGGAAYTKRVETTLLSEPTMLASPVTHLSFAKKLKVESVKGAWVQVSEGKHTGWVFGGNLAEEKPVEIKGLDGLPIAASETSATAAARPLTPAAEEYATRRHLGDASGDLTWLLTECQTITPDDLTQFLQDQKKGEYQ